MLSESNQSGLKIRSVGLASIFVQTILNLIKWKRGLQEIIKIQKLPTLSYSSILLTRKYIG
jgi:hypothetical protein